MPAIVEATEPRDQELLNKMLQQAQEVLQRAESDLASFLRDAAATGVPQSWLE